ncbi:MULTISPECIES: MaoC/PaaZ C-terminal domain-containing protein [Arthrobacter]|uniref:MaoC/PaaZ C-terminal domain-containing protein n=2 Tax=Arthrobacter TaxID=1663 RepID=A0ABU9KG23_9MICC|nr:MaoC/PaaZ C-terminal domain-containing protein [Arthrobacter sp. YJM1]MDP5225834.1 MaoC/PaaZ C-terminal domain-containing protein [Arthrobacter sp. YJM1]
MSTAALTVVLQEPPSLARLYLNAAATAAAHRLRKRPAATRVPEAVHELPALTVDLEHLTSFQRLLHATVRDELPSAYVHTLAFPVSMSVMTRDDFPLPLLGLVHLENSVEHHAAIPFTLPLTVRAHAENLAGHRAGTTVDMVAEVSDSVTRELLWRGVSTYLAKGVFFPGLDKPGTGGRNGERAREPFVPPTPTALWRLGQETGRDYAGVSGDFNPIHLSSLSARALGMKTSLAHGMYSVARVLAESGHDSDAGTRWHVGFEAPVYLPATVAVSLQDAQDPGGEWTGTAFQAWNGKSARRHFHGRIEPLGR